MTPDSRIGPCGKQGRLQKSRGATDAIVPAPSDIAKLPAAT